MDGTTGQAARASPSASEAPDRDPHKGEPPFILKRRIVAFLSAVRRSLYCSFEKLEDAHVMLSVLFFAVYESVYSCVGTPFTRIKILSGYTWVVRCSVPPYPTQHRVPWKANNGISESLDDESLTPSSPCPPRCVACGVSRDVMGLLDEGVTKNDEGNGVHGSGVLAREKKLWERVVWFMAASSAICRAPATAARGLSATNDTCDGRLLLLLLLSSPSSTFQ